MKYEIYYKIIKNIINNYNIKKRNYELLFNIKEIINNDIIKDINDINNENNIINKFNMIFNIYKKLNINEIKITLKVDQKDINKEI